MKRLVIIVLLIVYTALAGAPALKAEVRLPSIFGDNMVLQQKSNVSFWGKATPGSKVTIKTSWNNKSYAVSADSDGRWKTKVATPAAGGPYVITLSDGKVLTQIGRASCRGRV